MTAEAYLETRAWFNSNLSSRWFIVHGIVGLLTMVVTTLVTALSVAHRREQGTFDQLLVTPFRLGEILIAKALPGFITGLFDAMLIIIIAVLWFHIPLRGSLRTWYVGLFCLVLSTVGMGLMILSLAVSQQQGLLGAFLYLVPCIILSGFAMAKTHIPHWVQMITTLPPQLFPDHPAWRVPGRHTIPSAAGSILAHGHHRPGQSLPGWLPVPPTAVLKPHIAERRNHSVPAHVGQP